MRMRPTQSVSSYEGPGDYNAGRIRSLHDHALAMAGWHRLLVSRVQHPRPRAAFSPAPQGHARGTRLCALLVLGLALCSILGSSVAHPASAELAQKKIISLTGQILAVHGTTISVGEQ